jgi:putative oxidoreductase
MSRFATLATSPASHPGMPVAGVSPPTGHPAATGSGAVSHSLQTSAFVAGRVLLALIFITSGFAKLTGIEGTAAYIASAGLPAPVALAALAGALELFAGIALVIGFKARWAAAALAAFTLAATFVFHAYWASPAEQQAIQQLMFMKNLAIAGGLAIVAAIGAGSLSIDARRASA